MWRPSNEHQGISLYDPYTLFWLGALSGSYTIMSPAPVLALTFDRICALRPSDRIGQLRSSVFVAGICLIVGTYLATFGFIMLELPLDLTEGWPSFQFRFFKKIRPKNN